MNTTNRGSAAEQAAAQFLVRRGFTLIARNFRTPRCEIDIIVRDKHCMYFVEVKYRSRSGQGNGLDYVTLQKREHMRRAAEIWLQEYQWNGEVTLAAIEVAADYQVSELVELVD